MLVDVQRRQFKRTWRRVKNPLSRCWLRRQIAWCNALENKDKSNYYSKLISDNSHDSRKLWGALHKTLNKVSDVKLSSQESPPSDPPKITAFRQVSKEDVDKIIKTSPTKSCLLDPWPTFLIKECNDILLPSLTNWSTAHSCRLHPRSFQNCCGDSSY